jgi:diguanylate cyclase (GGDEF)-like protein
MSESIPHRRVLLAAEESARAEFRELFLAEVLRGWEMIEADSLERARFVLQLDPCDVLLLDASLYRGGADEDLSWLVGQRRAPVVFLADAEAELADAWRRGVHYWLPREVARRHAPVLAVMLRQAAEFADLQRRGQETNEALEDARRQVSRLVNLLWETVPGEGRARWFTQRYMLERLEEEVVRTQRYGGPLSVVLGEVEGPPAAKLSEDEAGQTATWVVEQISRLKRRCDVAGQYSLQGFMLLLPQTDESGAISCCRRLRQLLEQPAGTSEPLRVHFGIASFSPDAHSVKSLLSRAEELLEREKKGSSLLPQGKKE